jgi:hypothetical protein
MRNNSRTIINYVDRNLDLNKDVKHYDVCVFCGSISSLTQEHVLPRWVFEKSTKAFFTTDINGQRQTYNKTTVPSCVKCNSDILNSLETFIQHLFKGNDVKNIPFSIEESENIIRWLELIDYKFLLLNTKRKFLASKKGGYIEFLAKYPLSVLGEKADSPYKVVAEIRRSQKRITTMNKKSKLNSLVIFKTSNPDFYFFHNMDDFIFLELPKYKIALFYFYNKKFNSDITTYTEAMRIIRKEY